MSRKLLVVAVVWLFLGGLVGCGESSVHQDLRDYFAETKRQPKKHIDPLPAFSPYKAFSYGAMTLRSPFEKPVVEELRAFVASGESVKPDLSREREYLEGFNFASLAMVGTVLMGGVQWALVDDGEGDVHRVRVGNYLGKNHGKIIATSSSQVSVVEIVSDGVDGWVERPRTLKLEEKE